MTKKHNNSMRGSAVQITFITLLAVFLTLDAAPTRNDPATGGWTTTGCMGTGRVSHTATLLPSGDVLVTGGYTGAYLSSAELYDPATRSWSNTGSLGTAREWHTATLLPNGKVLVAGGFNGTNGTALSSAELYDPAAGMWTETGRLSQARQFHAATLRALLDQRGTV